MISVDYIDIQLRDLVAKNLIKGPQMKVMGKVITMTGGTSWKIGYEVDGPLAVREAARDVLKRGADFIKIYSTGGVLDPLTSPDNTVFFPEELRAAVEVAEAAGTIVASHAHGNTGIRNALKAGIHTIEHGTFLDDWCIEKMLKQGTYLIPTLSALHHILVHGLAGGIPKYVVEQAKYVHETQIIGFEKAVKAGVKIAAGTDCGCPFNYHGMTYYESELMVNGGMSNKNALMAITSVGAEVLQIADKYGSLENGKIADFVVLENNPLEDIKALQDVISVYQNGKKVI
jgi:imidazolonepropionase-like amidohydrolase